MSWIFGGWPPPAPSGAGLVTFAAVNAALALADANISINGFSLLDVTSVNNLPLSGGDSDCVRIGDSGMPLTPGFNRIAIGHNTGDSLTTANDVVAIGVRSQRFNTTGDSNVSVGNDSLSSLTTGGSNTAVGDNAALGLTTGSNNVALGTIALESLTTASRNTAVGHSAGHGTNAADGVFLGYQAGLLNSSGQQCIFIGSGAGSGATIGANNTVIGFAAGQALTTQSDAVMVGSGAGAGSAANGHICIGKDALAPDLAVASGISIGNRIYGGFNGAAYKFRFGGFGTIATQDECFDVESTGAADVPVMALKSAPAKCAIYVGNSDPSGVVSALGGALFLRVSGATSALYINRTAGTGTSWSLVTAVP